MFSLNINLLIEIFSKMSTKKLHSNDDTFYYITFTCFRWFNLFEMTDFYDSIYQWFEKLIKFQVYNCGYVIMPYHLHMLAYTHNHERAINNIIGTGKRFMAYEIVQRLNQSGRTELLQIMADAVTPAEMQRNKKHEVFQDSLDCKEVITEKFIRQKLNYIHKNPVSGKWKLVDQYLDYEYSSARFYDLGEEAKCRLYNYAELLSAR